LPLVVSGNCFGGHDIFSILWPQNQPVWQSLYSGPEQKCPQTTVSSHTRLRPLYQGPKVRPSGLLPSFVRPTGSKVEGRPMRVNDLLRMELMAECLGKQPALLVQERP